MANIFDDLENQDGLVVDEKELLRRRLEAQQNPFLASEQASSSMPASPLQERFDAGVVERMKIPTLKGQDVSIDEQTGLITSIPSPVEPEKIKTEASVVSDDDLNFIDKGSKKDLAGTLDDLTKKFGKHGITFKVNADGGYETRLSDRYERIEVIAANQTKKNILYDAFTKSIVKSDANELKSFIKSNAIKTNYVPRNREEAEAIQAYSKQGLDYGLVKKSDNDMKALETSLKEANAINDLIESNARKAATSTGKVALAYKAKAKELESQFKNEYGVTPQAYIDSNSQKLKSLRDTKISNLDKSIKADREIQGRVKVLDEKAKGLLGESNKLIESAKELSINGLGVPLFKEDGSFNEEGLKKIVPNETNQGVINQIRHNLTLSDNYRKAAHSGKLQAMNYLSAQQNKNLQDQYVSNWEGFLNNATNAYRSAESTMLSLATSAAKWAGKEELAKLWNDRMLEQMYKPPLDVSSDQELINLIRQYGDPDDYLKSLGPDPLRAFNAAANMTVSSMLLFLPQMVAASGTGAGISGTLAALGTLAATRNPALARQAFVAGASTGSRVGAQYVAPTSLEYSTSLIDAIRKKYPTIEEAREKDWWNDKEIMDEALRIGVSRGIPITGAGAMFDFLSKKFAPLATASKARRVGQTLAVGAAISPVIEGAGEAAAQYASVGELDWKDIIDESVGSLGSSTVIPTLPYEVYSQLNKDYYINLADKMAKSPSFLGSMEESMEQIRDWTGRMKATRQITDDVERQIMGNMSAILEARKLLTSPDASNSERTYNRLFGTKSATEERLSKLLLAQKKMEETPKINRELQRRIQEEIDYTVTNGKPIDKQQAVNLTPIIGSEGAMYKIGDTLVTRDDVKEALVDKEKAKEMGLKEDFSNLSIENDQVLKEVVKQVSPKKVLFQQPGVSDTPSSGKTIVFHGGTLDGEGNIYVSPSREQAAEYAKMSKTSVMEFEVDPESMAQEDEVRDAFEELGLQLPEGYNLDELFLYEALDPRLASSLKKEDIKKLYDYLKQKGYEGISFIDEDILGKDKKGVSNYIVFAKESLKPIKRDTPKASEAANVLGTIAKSKDIFNKIGEIVASWVDGDIEIDEQTGNIKITQSLDGKKIVGVPASKLIDFLFSDAPFDTRKFPVDKEWIDTIVRLRDSIIEENRAQKKKTKEKRVAKKGGIINGDEVVASAVKMGTDEGFSEFTLKRIAKEDYTEEEVSIEGLLMGDPSLKEYVDAGQLRAQPEAKPEVVEQGSKAFLESVKAAFPKRGMFGGVVITDADGTELAEGSFQIKDDENIGGISDEIPKIELSSFLSLKAGSRQGFGKRALAVIKDMADKHGVQIILVPDPLRFLKIKGVNKKFLERFYGKNGFKSPHRLSSYMVYLPQTKTSDTTKRARELPKSNKEISKIIKALFKGERDALENVLFNWDGIELVFDEIYDEIKFKGYVGRDRQFSRGEEGGTRVASKKEFLRWLMSDEPNNVEEFGEDAEWVSNINKLRAVVDGLTIGEPAPQQQPEATVGIPPIVSSNGDVIDGYNRILQAVMDGKDSIKVLKGIPKEAPIPKRKPPMQRLMEAGVKAGISAKNITDLYNVNRDVFGLNISQSIANSIVMDRMMGAMAKRKGVSKDEIYKSIKFQNVTEEFIKTLSEESKPLFQMVGKNAKLSAQVFTQLEEAKKMRAENTVQKLRAPNDPPKYSELDIKWKTGWEFNPVDNKWRYEIDYGKAKDISLDNELWSKYDPSTKKGIEKGFAMAGLEFDYLHGVLSDFLDNQELFDAYPDIKNIKFKIRLSYSDSFNNVPITPQLVNQWAKSEFEGHVTSGKSIKDIIAAGGEIQLNTPPLPSKWSESERIDFLQRFFSRQDTRNEVLALINHEAQHLIQQEEGFIEGSYVQDKYRGSKGLDLLMRRGPKQKVFDNNQKAFIKGKTIGDALEVLDDWYKKFPNSTNEQSLGFVFTAARDSIKSLEEDLRELKQNEPNRKDAISETADKIERLKIAEKLLIDIYSDVKPDEDLVAYLEKLRGRYFGTLYKRNVIPYQVYYRVAGEAEARTAADRGRMSDNMRQYTLIADTVAGVSLAERLAFAYPGTLKFQGPQGAVAIGQDASAVIYAISNPNVTTPLHELAHVFESYLTEKERQAVMNSAGTPNEWNVTTSEYFARGFERYLAEGVAPSTILKSLFEAFKSWLIEIYNGITGSDIDVELNEAMRGIYSSMLGFERPKPTIASYFSGSGTMEGAFGGDVRSGLAVEFSPDYINAYNKAFGKDYEPRDVNEVSPQEIKDLDPLLFHASPVCKNYSLAKDPSQRGTTDLDIKSANSVAAAISAAKPPIVTIENVGGYKGDVPYNIIIEALEKAGYKYDANIYDVADYGGVQTRKRVLIRAIREGELPPLPDKIGPKDWYSAIEDLIPNAPDHVIGEQAKRNIDKAMGRKPEAQQQAQPQLSDYDYFWQSKLGKDIQKKINIGRIRGLRGFKVNRNQIKLYKSSLPIIVMGEGQYGPMAANSGGPSPTLVSSSAQTAFIVLPETKQLKVLTPRMMARIMDLPDTYTVPSDYKTAKEVLGNGMSGVLTRQFIMPLIFGNSVTLAKNPTLLFQQPGAKQNTFENDGTMLNVDANAPVIAGSNLPPAVKKATKETNSEYYAEYRASDLIKTTHAPSSALVGLIRSLSSGQVSGEGITINLPFEDKKTTNKIDQLISEYQKLSDKVADKKRKQEITEELNKITKNYMGEVVKKMTLNILALYDTLTPAFIQRARNWYVGANRIANTMASKYGLSLEQTAGILAVFSPKTDWQINVSHAERLIDVIQNYSDLKVDKNFIGKVRKKIEGTRKGGVLNDKDEEFLELLSNATSNYPNGMSINEMSDIGFDESTQGLLVRAIMTEKFPKTYAETYPEGDLFRKAKKAYAESSYDFMGKAIRIYRNNSLGVIHEEIGDANKVRNFYNNIVDPFSPVPYVTGDTHAIAAAMGMPLAADDAGLLKLFVGGISPMYTMLKEAYIAATEVVNQNDGTDFLPREMQSIIWEAIRMGMNDLSTTLREELNEELVKNKKENSYEKTRRVLAEFRQKGIRTKNPEWGGSGFSVQISKIQRASKEETNKRVSQVVAVWRQLRGGKGGNLTTALGREFRVKLNNFYASFLASRGDVSRSLELARFLNRAFPGVSVFVDKTSFQEVMKEPETKKVLNGKNNLIYGVTKNGRIYINPDVFASDIELMETMIHEFGHIWINYIKVNNRELYEQGIKLVMSEYPDEYKTELLLNKNNKERAAEEVLATLIGKKGQLEGKAMRRGIAIASGVNPDKVKDVTVAGFSNWLNKMWEYVRKEFRSLRGLSVEEIQNITLTEFIDGALFDLFSGEPVPQSQLAFENSLVQEPQFNSSTSMYDLINQARNDGYRDAEIRRVLEVNGFAAEDINDALKVYLDVLTVMPGSFAQVPGGAFAGQRMYESLMADVQAYAKTGVKSAQVREYAQNKLKDQQLFKDSTEFQRMAMMVDLDKSINISANKAITAEMRKIRAAIAGIKKGKSQMSAIQRSLISFIKKSLPVSTYEKRDVVDLMRKIQALDLNNIDQIKREVFDYVTKFRIKNEKERLQTLLSTKLAKLESSRLKGLMSVEFQERFSELKSNLMGESDALTNPSKVEDKIAELNVEFLDVQNQVFAQGMNELWGKMEDLQFAIQYNSTLLLDDDNPNKLLSLEELVEKVDALISAERSSFKDFLKSESERYNEMKNYLLYDISSGKYDVNFNNKEEVEDAITQIENDQLDEKKRNWFMAAINRIVSILDLSVLNTEDLDSVIDRISKATGQLFGGITQELIGQRIDDSRDNFIALRAMAKEMISQNAERIFGKNYRDVMERNSKKSFIIEINRDTSPAKRPIKRIELSQNEMYYLYNLYKDQANHPGFKTLMGDSYPEVMREIFSKLDPQVIEWANWQVDEFYPAMYPIYNEVYKSIYRTNMPWNAHYAGRVFREGMPDFSTIDFLRDPKGFKMFAGGQSTKARVKNSAAIRPMDGDYVLRSYVKDMNFFAAFGEAFRDLSKLLNNPLIRKAMDAFVGEDVRKYLGLQQGEEKGGVLDAVLSANLNRSNEPAILESITKGYVFAKLGVNFRVFLYQTASFLNFTMFIGYRNYALFAAKAFGNLATGGKSNAYRLFKQMYENSQYLRDREDTESILDLMAGFNAKNAKGETKSLLDRVTEGSVGAALMFMLRNGDKAGIAGSIPNYLYYKTEYANRYGVDLDSQEAIDYAIKKVNKQVRKVAQDNESENKSLLQSTGGALAKGFYLFASQPLQLLRKEIRSVRNIYRILAGLEGAKGTLQENARVFITAHFVSPLVFQWLALGLPGVARKWNDDDEDELILAAIIGNLNQIFVLGQLLDTAKDAILKKPWAKVPETAVPYKIVTQLAVLMVDAINTTDADKRLDAQIKFAIAIAELSGIPASTMLGLFKNYEKLLKGEVSGFGEAFLRMFNFPERQITGPKKDKNPYAPSGGSSRSRKSENPYAP